MQHDEVAYSDGWSLYFEQQRPVLVRAARSASSQSDS